MEKSMTYIVSPHHRNTAPDLIHIITAIDRELSILGNQRTITKERLQAARWVLTCPEDDFDDALCALQESGFDEDDGGRCV